MKAKDFTLRVVNEIEEGKFEIREFKPYMSYESFVGCILGDAEILRPTGLKDNNGKEIYEGNILENILGHRAKVVFEKGSFIVDFGLIKYLLNDVIELQNLIIVGNIYQNPDLLK